MATNIEIEVKALVKEKDFNKFVKTFKQEAKNSYVQTNYYIDDEESSLAHAGIALRIRKKDRYKLTLKTPLSEGLLEKNQNISNEEFKKLKSDCAIPEGDIKRFLTMLGFDIDKLKIITSLTTTRIDIPYQDGLLSLDKNEYNKHIDYEIEYEYNSKDGANAVMKKLFRKLNVPYVENHTSKVMRAFNALNK